MKTIRLLPLLALAAGLCVPHARAKLETWTDLDGRSMEAEFVSASDAYVSFRKADGGRYIFPFDKLSATDQARVRELTGKASNDTQPPAAPATASAPAPENTAPAAPGKFTSEIAGKLVSLKGGKLSPHSAANPSGAKYYALYYSAQWCPPCRKFTPDLVAAYKTLKAKNPDFELIFVSSDQDADAMKTYMADYKMPWPALRHDLGRSLSAAKRYSARGIPNLVFITADGEVLSTSYVDGKYVGPRKVLADIQAKLKG